MTEKRDSEHKFDDIKYKDFFEEKIFKEEIKELPAPRKDDNPTCSKCGQKMNSLIYTHEKRSYHKCRFCGHSYVNKHN